MAERVKSGIYGLDELIEGGFPKGRTILVSGACGTGKSIFGMQYVYNGAAQYDEPGLFVTFDERPEMLREDMLRFGWDVKKYEEDEKFGLFDMTATRIGVPSEEKYAMPQMVVDVDRLIARLSQICTQMKAKRIAIDSIASLGLHLKDEADIRRMILKINHTLANCGVTTIITSEIPMMNQNVFSKYGVEEYAADGVIILDYNTMQETPRTLYIRKMRGTRHSEHIHSLEINAKGLSVGRLGEK